MYFFINIFFFLELIFIKWQKWQGKNIFKSCAAIIFWFHIFSIPASYGTVQNEAQRFDKATPMITLVPVGIVFPSEQEQLVVPNKNQLHPGSIQSHPQSASHPASSPRFAMPGAQLLGLGGLGMGGAGYGNTGLNNQYSNLHNGEWDVFILKFVRILDQVNFVLVRVQIFVGDIFRRFCIRTYVNGLQDGQAKTLTMRVQSGCCFPLRENLCYIPKN